MRLRIQTLSRYRPRILTLIVLFVVATLILLANLSDENSWRRMETNAWTPPLTFSLREPEHGDPFYGFVLHNVSGGWPLLWRQSVAAQGMAGPTQLIGQCHSATRLAANSAIWIVMLVAAAGACEWLVRRHPPRFRWNLRSMLSAVALFAACCAWFAAARSRADAQDPIIDETAWGERSILMECWGPEWFKVVGLDRFCRRVVGVSSKPALDNSEQAQAHHERLQRLKRLPDLQYLFCDMDAALPEAMVELRQLKVLSVDALGWEYDRRTCQELLAAIGEMSHLEHLRLESMTIDDKSLSRLAGLRSLKSLSLESVSIEGRDWGSDPPLLAYLPALTRLEAIDVHSSDIRDGDLPRLAAFPKLKSLNLASTDVTSAGLLELSRVRSLEELAVDSYILTPEGLASLLAVHRLRKLHVNNIGYASPVGFLTLDDGAEFEVPASEIDLHRRAMDALRRSHPRMVIDGDENELKLDADRKILSQYPFRWTREATRGGFPRSWQWRKQRN